MNNKNVNLDILNILAENQVSIQFTPKCIWLSKVSSKVSIVSPDLCIKLSKYDNDKTEALFQGLKLLGVNV